MGFVGGGGAGPNEVFVQGDVSPRSQFTAFLLSTMWHNRHVKCADQGMMERSYCYATSATKVRCAFWLSPPGAHQRFLWSCRISYILPRSTAIKGSNERGMVLSFLSPRNRQRLRIRRWTRSFATLFSGTSSRLQARVFQDTSPINSTTYAR